MVITKNHLQSGSILNHQSSVVKSLSIKLGPLCVNSSFSSRLGQCHRSNFILHNSSLLHIHRGNVKAFWQGYQWISQIFYDLHLVCFSSIVTTLATLLKCEVGMQVCRMGTYSMAIEVKVGSSSSHFPFYYYFNTLSKATYPPLLCMSHSLKKSNHHLS